jgi:hypothetical protein
VKGKVGKVPVQVIVDTGAEHTLGNMALRTALLDPSRNTSHAKAGSRAMAGSSVCIPPARAMLSGVADLKAMAHLSSTPASSTSAKRGP